MYEPYVEVCRLLAEVSPCRGSEQRSVLLNSGAEAVENAVKIARASTGRPAVLVFGGAFHGRTLADDDDDQQGPLQAGLRAVRPGGLPRAFAVSVPEASRPTTRSPRSSSSSRPRSIRRRSPAPCSSPCRARADSSRCRRTSRSGCGVARPPRDPLRRRRGPTASGAPGPNIGRSSSTGSSPTSSSRASRWAAASRSRPSPARRRSSTP